MQEDGYVMFIKERTASATLHQAPFYVRYTPFCSNVPCHFTSLLILHSLLLKLKPFWLAYFPVFKSFLLREHHLLCKRFMNQASFYESN
jgi:hypothetical protein